MSMPSDGAIPQSNELTVNSATHGRIRANIAAQNAGWRSAS